MARYYNGPRYIGCEKPVTINYDEIPNFKIPVEIPQFPNRVPRSDVLRQNIDTYLGEIDSAMMGASINGAPEYVHEGLVNMKGMYTFLREMGAITIGNALEMLSNGKVQFNFVLGWINDGMGCDQHYAFDAIAKGYNLVNEIGRRKQELVSREDFIRDPDLPKLDFRFSQYVPKEGKRGFRWDIEKD